MEVRMGKEDVAARKYLSDPARFADLFNHEVYGGRAVIDPFELDEADPTELSGSVEKDRDICKDWVRKSDGRTTYAVLGLEEQTGGHLAMPVRCALYDAMTYDSQVRAIARENRREGMAGASPAEFLSGLWESDRIRPVVTLVLYLGSGDWTWPETLHGMLGDGVDGSLLEFVPDYHMNLVAPARIPGEDLDTFSTELGLALKYVKHSSDRGDLDRMVHEDERFGSVDAETASFQNVITKSALRIVPEGGRVNMCKAIDDMRREERLQGERKNLLGNLRSLMANMGWELGEAFDALDVSESERASIAAELGVTT